ncbi:hypothetical protein [Leminorella grimontii]|uniref:hypothetical protein n=1 Tax=Leminorella grimontii TaxID=82981 RepID=UPI00321FDD18
MMRIYPNIENAQLQKWHTDFLQNYNYELEEVTNKAFAMWKNVEAQSYRGYPNDVKTLHEWLLPIYHRLNNVSNDSQERWLGQILTLLSIYHAHTSQDTNQRKQVMDEFTHIAEGIYQEAAAAMNDPGEFVMRMFTLPIGATRWIAAEDLTPVIQLEILQELFTHNPTIERAELYFYRAIELQIEIQERIFEGLQFHRAQQEMLWNEANTEVERLVAAAGAQRDPWVRLRTLGSQMFTNHPNKYTYRILLAFLNKLSVDDGFSRKISGWEVEVAELANAEQRTGPTSFFSLLSLPVSPDIYYADYLWEAFVALLVSNNALSQDAYPGARQHDKLLAAVEGIEVAIFDLVPFMNLAAGYIQTPHLPANIRQGIDLAAMVVSEFIPGGSIAEALNEVGKTVSILAKEAKALEGTLATEIRALAQIRNEAKATEHIPFSGYEVTLKNVRELKPVNGYSGIHVDNAGNYYLFQDGRYYEVYWHPGQDRFQLFNGNDLFKPHFAMKQSPQGRWQFHPMLAEEVLTEAKKTASSVSLPEEYKVFPEGPLSEEEGTGILFDEKGHHYINQSGDIYPVLFDAGNDTWRVYSTEGKNVKYQYPVFLDEEGVWQTHSDVGLKGGGKVQNPPLTAEEKQQVVDALREQQRQEGKVNYAEISRRLTHLRNGLGVRPGLVGKIAAKENIGSSFTKIPESVKDNIITMLNNNIAVDDIIKEVAKEYRTLTRKTILDIKLTLGISSRRPIIKLTDEQVDFIVRLTSESYSTKDIAIKMNEAYPGLGITRSRIGYELKKKNIRPAYSTGGGASTKYPEDVQQKIVELYETKSSVVIARELTQSGTPINSNAVRDILRTHGIIPAEVYNRGVISEEIESLVIQKLELMKANNQPLSFTQVSREIAAEIGYVAKSTVRKIALRNKLIPGFVPEMELFELIDRFTNAENESFTQVASELAKRNIEATPIGLSRRAVRMRISSNVALVTRGQARQIFDLSDFGMSAADISKELKINIRRVWDTLKNFNSETGTRAWWRAEPQIRTGIIKALEDGERNTALIAGRFKVQAETVRGIANQIIWARNKLIVGRLGQGKTIEAVAKEFGISKSVVARVAKDMPPSTHDIHLTAAERAEVWTLLNQRGEGALTKQEIAEKQGISYWMVEKIQHDESQRVLDSIPVETRDSAIFMLRNDLEPQDIMHNLGLSEEEMGVIEREDAAGNIIIAPPLPGSSASTIRVITELTDEQKIQALDLLIKGNSLQKVTEILGIKYIHSIERIMENIDALPLEDLDELEEFLDLPAKRPRIDEPGPSGIPAAPEKPVSPEESSPETPATPEKPVSPEHQYNNVFDLPEGDQNVIVEEYRRGRTLTSIADRFNIEKEALRSFLAIKLEKRYITEEFKDVMDW